MEQSEMPQRSSPSKKELRKFSKAHSMSERDQVARIIKEKRAENFNQKRNLLEEIQRVIIEVQEKNKNVIDTKAEVEGLERVIADHKNSKILEILNYFKIKKLQKEIGEKILNQEKQEEEYRALQNFLRKLSEQKEEKESLDEAKSILEDFYHGEEKKWQEYVEDQEVRDIKNISEELDVWFIHGIHPNFVPDFNSLLFEGTDWETKLKIILSLNPTLSTSTIKEGDSALNMWARMGVVLSGGSVVDASPGDAGTIASSLGTRTGHGFTDIPIREKIFQAVSQRDKNNYNEIVVENPKIFGFYICLDEYKNLVKGKQDRVSHEEIFQVTQGMGVPVLVLEQGILSTARYDESTKKFVKEKEVKVGSVDDFEISDMEQQKFITELLVDSPFKIKSPEVAYIDSRDQGRQQYFEMNVQKNFQNFDGEEIIFDGNSIFGSPSEVNMRAKVVSTFPVRTGVCKYILSEEGTLYKVSENSKTRKIVTFPIDRVRESIDIGWNVDNLGRPLENSETYLLAMREHLEDLQKKRDSSVGNEKYPGETDFYDDWIKKLAFHLYGYAEQAGLDGKEEIQEEALGIVKKFLPFESYKEVVKRRVDDQGRFKIQKEDILL